MKRAIRSEWLRSPQASCRRRWRAALVVAIPALGSLVAPPLVAAEAGHAAQTVPSLVGPCELPIDNGTPYAFRADRYPCSFDDSIRALSLKTKSIDYVVGGTKAWSNPTSGPLTLPRLAEVLHDESLLREVEPGVWEVSVAIIVRAGASLSIAKPEVKELRLVEGALTALVVNGGSLSITDTKVVGWDAATGQPTLAKDGVARPHVVARGNGSQLNIQAAEFDSLGVDRGDARGVTFSAGAFGRVEASTFTRMASGVQARLVSGIEIRSNTFTDISGTGVLVREASGVSVVGNDFVRNRGAAVEVRAGAAGTVVKDANITSPGDAGVRVDGGAVRTDLGNLAITDPSEDGVVIGESQATTLSTAAIRRARIGVRVDDHAEGVTLTNPTIVASGRGIVIDADDPVAVNNVVMDDIRQTGIVVDGGGLNLETATIGRPDIGLDIAASSTVHDAHIEAADTGAVVRSGADAELSDSSIDAPDAVRSETGGRMSSDGLSITGEVLDPSRNLSTSPPPLQSDQLRRNPLALWGAFFIVLAVILEVAHLLFHRMRESRQRRNADADASAALLPADASDIATEDEATAASGSLAGSAS